MLHFSIFQTFLSNCVRLLCFENAMGFDVVNLRAFFSGICTTTENLEMPEIISD